MNKVTDSPLISVLLSVYNDEKNIKKSLDSILLQSYKNIELLVMDDCSLDRTYEILNEINDMKRFNLDKKSLMFSLQEILTNESK